jgi:hypothetical protein
MKKRISFPSIEQFRNVVASVNRRHDFVGLDENGEAIYDTNREKPTLTFKGTVKLHGTNAGVCFNNESGLWAQSRSNVITSQSDNAGFAFFVETNSDIFIDIVNKIASRSNIDLDNNTISVYGEWAGGNIQKGVGITNLPKSFFIFGVKVTPHVGDNESKESAYWIDYSDLRNTDARIYNIDDFETYSIDIDFNTPETVQNKLSELTLAVEEECPVAKAFGFSGIGEGIVWSYTDEKGATLRFKVKGEKHSSSKVKTLASVDVEKVASIREFVDYAVTESRFNQAIENVFPNNEPVDIKKIGEVMKWINGDIIKEESDTLKENNLEPKDVNKYVSAKVREMFMALPINQ